MCVGMKQIACEMTQVRVYVEKSCGRRLFHVENLKLAFTRAGKSSKRNIVLRDYVPLILDELAKTPTEQRQKQKERHMKRY